MTARTALPSARSRDAAPARTSALQRAHRELLAVLLVFVATVFVVPTLAPVTISDDWIYMRSVRVLVEQHRLDVHPLVSSNLVFQIGWGALFGAVFGVTAGVMRISTIVLWLLAGASCYGLMYTLTRRRGLSALGAAAFLFNPLGYVLTFTFMTDAPFTALVLISTYASVQALQGDGIRLRWLLAGSAVASAAVLTRQPGLMIPLGTLTGFLLTRRLSWDRRSLLLATVLAAPPLLSYAAYYFWLTTVNGVPVTQTIMREDILRGGFPAVAIHITKLAGIEVLYGGLFMLPVVAPAALGVRRLVQSLSSVEWMSFGVWQSFVVSAVVGLAALGMRMPYVPHFLSAAGLGPNDLIFFGRWAIMGSATLWMLTLICAFSALCGGLLLIRAWLAASTQGSSRDAVALVIGTLAWQAAAVFVVSSHFRTWSVQGVPVPTLDRYLLPLLPLVLCVVVWAVRDITRPLFLGWYITAVLGAFAVIGTRDNIVFHEATWDFARQAIASGIPLERLDAGGSWTGYHLGEYSYDTRGIVPNSDGRWWLALYGSAIDPEYVIATTEAHGYTTIAEREYPLLLDARPAHLYLLRRDGPR